ncbi:MAG: glycosyltransferase family 4 protein [Verrucomicrobiota bacterium]
MKIGLITCFFPDSERSCSGIGNHFLTLAEALAERGHEVTVLHVCDEETYRRGESFIRDRLLHFDYYRIPKAESQGNGGGGFLSWAVREMLDRIRTASRVAWIVRAIADERSFDVMETHSYHYPGLFFRFFRFRKCVVTRVSTTARQMVPAQTVRSRVFAVEAFLEGSTIRSARHLVTHSPSHRDEVARDERVDPDRFMIVPHGVVDIEDATRLEPSDQIAGFVQVLFVGRFETRKGVDLLLEAIPEVIDSNPAIIFELVGQDDGHPAWEEFQKQYPQWIGEKVIARGVVEEEELLQAYAECDLFVAPSRYESFGLIYVEAMRFSKPVVGYEVGGVPDVVRDRETGILVEPFSIDGLVEAITELGRLPGLRREMGNAGRKDFERRFSVEALAQHSEDLYRTILP